MIDFACKKLNIEEIIKCSLGLTKAEQTLLKHMLKKQKEYTSEKLNEETSLELSTVQRSLKNLHMKKLIDRSQKNLEHGGYVFCYKSRPREELRKMMQSIVTVWVANVDKALGLWAKE